MGLWGLEIVMMYDNFRSPHLSQIITPAKEIFQKCLECNNFPYFYESTVTTHRNDRAAVVTIVRGEVCCTLRSRDFGSKESFSCETIRDIKTEAAIFIVAIKRG